ncbi:MAG: hypothetical protein IPJ78_07255 [Gemmatimonadetes bacterium]|nr:hypothetical protein [Gemmatimonadota bacterium]
MSHEVARTEKEVRRGEHPDHERGRRVDESRLDTQPNVSGTPALMLRRSRDCDRTNSSVPGVSRFHVGLGERLCTDVAQSLRSPP